MDTLKKAENATVGKIKSLNFNDLKAAARNFSVSPYGARLCENPDAELDQEISEII
jgi:hypothetical protein